MNNAFLIDLAILPGVVLLVYIYIKDRVEKEPLGLLLLLLIGGCLSAGASILLENVAEYVLYFFSGFGTFIYTFISVFVGVALIEELTKYIFLNIFSWNSKHFNCTFDGVLYAIFVSLGFAILENVLYVTQFGLETALARAFTAVPGHMVDSIIMGLFYSKAKLMQKRIPGSNYRSVKLAGLCLATISHGIYDFLLNLQSDLAIIIWMVFVAITYIFAFIAIRKASKEDQYI